MAVGVLGALLFIHVFTLMCLVFSHAALLICTIRFDKPYYTIWLVAIVGTAWFSWGYPCPLVLCRIGGFLVRYRNKYGMIGVLVQCASWYCAVLWTSRYGFSMIGVLVWYASWYCVVWWVSSPWETPHPHTQPAIMISPSLLSSSSSSSTYYFSTSLCNHVGNTFVFLLTSECFWEDALLNWLPWSNSFTHCFQKCFQITWRDKMICNCMTLYNHGKLDLVWSLMQR